MVLDIGIVVFVGRGVEYVVIIGEEGLVVIIFVVNVADSVFQIWCVVVLV